MIGFPDFHQQDCTQNWKLTECITRLLSKLLDPKALLFALCVLCVRILTFSASDPIALGPNKLDASGPKKNMQLNTNGDGHYKKQPLNWIFGF